MGRFQFGQIIEAYISDGHGRTKERPALIISSDLDNDRGEDLQVVAITTKIENPSPPYHIVIASMSKPDPRTGLSRPCVAKCNWLRNVKQNKVIRSRGYVDPDLLDEIVDQLDKLYSDKTFNDWA